MTIVFETRKTNWLGLSSTVGLFIWFLYWFKNEPHSFFAHALLWGPLALIHICAILAARRSFGWFYLIPVGVFWLLIAIALTGASG